MGTLEQRKQLGNRSEQLACSFLEQKGYHLLQKNFSSRWGEIDLIFRKGQDLIFVEVRSKSSGRYGQPLETITSKKQEHLRRTAQYYLCQHRELEQCYCRFDVISVLWQEGKAQLQWLTDAFQ